MYRLDLAKTVFQNKAGIVLDWGSRIEIDDTVDPSLTYKAQGVALIWKYYSRNHLGDGKTIPVIYVDEFREDSDTDGIGVAPPRSKARGVVNAFSIKQRGSPLQYPTLPSVTVHELGHAIGDLVDIYGTANDDPSRLMSNRGGLRLIDEEIYRLRWNAFFIR